MTRHLTVDPIACEGHGICAELLPEHISLDDWGFPIVDPDAIPEHHLADARRAIKHCPALALRLRQMVPGRDRIESG
jgi:ferredoxin